jgi:hypothetical protein
VSLQECPAAVEQLASRAFVGLPEYFIQRESACAFIDGVKQHLFMGVEESPLKPLTRP